MAAKKPAKNFIKKAIKKPGALRATAKKMGMLKNDQTLTMADLNMLAKSKDPKTRQRANFAKMLMHLPKRGGGKKKT